MMGRDGMSRARVVGIVMDGNGRWADLRGLPRTEGHRQGSRALFRAVEAAICHGVEHLFLFAFSTENWRRPAEEVSFLMDLLSKNLSLQRARVLELGVRFHAIGRLTALPAALRESIRRLEAASAGCGVVNVYLAVNYGGRAEIVDAARAACRVGGADALDENSLERHLYAPDAPDLDLLIRTAGERRVSNFMLWQAAYAELVFLPVLWPDFSHVHFDAAMSEFSRRRRRFGALGD